MKSKKIDKRRIPIVTVMGHVDHGKTSLLDYIRGSKVQQSEQGGITQKIRLHKVETTKGFITFIDTPGHEAFTALREKGSSVTDMILLVVAADDGIRAQTLESIKYAKDGKIPIIVAINKIDIVGDKLDKIKQELASADVLVEDWGGDVLAVPISAKEGTNIDKLIDAIFLQAELIDLKDTKPRNYKSKFIVLESRIDQSLGKTALAVIKEGTLDKFDYIVDKDIEKPLKIKGIIDENFKEIMQVSSGDPVNIPGLRSMPELGTVMYGFANYEEAEEYIENLNEKEDGEESVNSLSEDPNLEELFAKQFKDIKKDKQQEKKVLSVILKADTLGSLEAIKQEIQKINDDFVEAKIVKAETGEISESDILIARATRSIILGFNQSISNTISDIAKREKVIVRNYSIIYEMIDELAAVLDSLIIPEETEVVLGSAKVSKIFVLSKGEIIAGCIVSDGTIKKGYKAHVERDKEIVATGTIVSLRRQKDEIKEALKGSECGILLEPQFTVEAGDKIRCFRIEKNT